MRIGYFFNAFVIPRDLGYVTGADGGFKLAVRRSRQPDVAFISKARLPELPRDFKIAPDIAVEVVSENEDIFKKAREYLQAGTRFAWAVYTDEKVVFVCTLDDDGTLRWQPFDINSTLDGGEVLPGFRLAVRDIFPE
jgi:Uma2 family endonuclease